MKKLTALLLALVLALGLTACTRNDTKKLAGTWTYRADITERINQRVKEALELEQVSPDAAVSVYLTFTVTPDGAYTLALDTASIEKDRAAYMEALRPVLAEALYVQAEDEGYTREQYDEALESLGMTAEDCADTIIAAFDLNTFLTLLRGSHDSDTISAGYCKAEEGRLYFSATADLSEADFAGYALSGDTMTWTDEDGAAAALLTEEERALIHRLADGDETVKDQLIVRNLRLVVYIARKFDAAGAGIEDLISIGTIGLIKAVNTFCPSRNIKLATYASRCIENEILMYLRKSTVLKTEISIEEPLNVDWDGNELLLSDVLGSESDTVNRGIEQEDEQKLLKQLVRRLSEREQAIMSMRFGLDGQGEHTQKEVADLMGISQSYISRLEKKIIERLKQDMERAMI